MSEGTQTTDSERMQIFMDNLLVQEQDEQPVGADVAEIDPATISAIIAVASWIMANQEFINDVAGWYSRAFRQVTNIKRWQNETDQEVEVWKLDGGSGKKDHYRIPPNQTLNAEMWIPWADNPGTGKLRYGDHHAVITVGGQPLAYIWQNGTLIRFNTIDAFVDGGVAVPGASGAGGDRTMILAKNPQGQVGFALGTYKK